MGVFLKVKSGKWSASDVALLTEAVRCGIPLPLLSSVIGRKFDSIRSKYRQLRRDGLCDEAGGKWQYRSGRDWPMPSDERLLPAWEYSMMRYSTEFDERIEDMRGDPLALFAAAVSYDCGSLSSEPGFAVEFSAQGVSPGLSDASVSLSVEILP